MAHYKNTFFIAFLIVLVSFKIGAQEEELPLAMGGIDILSIYNQGIDSNESTYNESKYLYGKNEYSVIAENMRWLFNSEEHARLFSLTPETYMPLFKGYGAWGVARGNILQPNPELWLLSGGKLLFFHSRGTLRSWKKDPERLLSEALRRWPELEAEILASEGNIE